ncbi:MAG: U32 family peptidase [Treponema sp.]|jgi:putative protease|nr:U32 family peptidase [Treponema sp.]
MSNVELLAPAGSPEALDAAIGEGADGVYLGLKTFNARLRSANFTYAQFEGALRILHRMRRKVYVTVNTVFEERETDRVYQLLKYLAGLGPDGIIVQDFGAARMVREYFPSLKLHASTQMNSASAKTVNLLSKRGFSRVVLARELSLEEIRELRLRTNAELEVFVHGALCVSASGLCLFSSFLGGKSANRGLCTQACRRIYQAGAAGSESKSGYYFSPADLQLIEKIPDLADAGINSFKIEGRMKSAEYVGVVVAAYRRLIDSLDGDRERGIQEAQELLLRDFARKKTLFYFNGNEGDWLRPEQDGGTGIPLGTIQMVKGSERLGLIAADTVTLGVGDSLRFHKADDSQRVSHKITSAIPESSPEAPSGCAVANRQGGIWVSIPHGFEQGDSVYLIQTKARGKRPPVLPRNLDNFRRLPGRDKAPALNLLPLKKKELPFPEGIYTGISRIEDLYVVQSVRPVRVMLSYNQRTAAYLLGENNPPLPFKRAEIILVLDPYFPQAQEEPLGENLRRLRERGYSQFVLNNLGHFSYFRDTPQGVEPALLIAGPYLYTFNRQALSFVTALGTGMVVSPLENNRQNLERTVEKGRASIFVTLFAYPALFRIRADLGGLYDFEEFQDSRGEEFRLLGGGQTGGAGSLVIPRRPFSIVDKLPFLQQAGFSRFILDFSGPPLRKKDYKDVMAALTAVSPLPNTSRFNWKNGFYHEESTTSP